MVGVDWYWLKLPGVLCWLGHGVIWWRYLRGKLTPGAAWLFVLAVVFLPSYADNSRDVLSEATFSLFLTASVVIFSNHLEFPGRRRGPALVLGLACLAAVILSRSVGMFLSPCLLLIFLGHRRWLEAAGVVGATALALALKSALGASDGGYLEQLGGLAGWGVTCLILLPRKLASLCDAFLPFSGVGMPAMILAGVLGFLTPLAAILAERWRRRRLELRDLIAPAYLAAIFAWPFHQGTRFFVPIVPWLLLLLVEGWGLILRRVFAAGSARPDRLLAGFLLLLSLANLGSSLAEATLLPRRDLGVYHDAIAWMQANLGPEDHYLSRRNRGLALLLNRTGAYYNPHQPEGAQDKIARLGLNHIFVNKKRREEAGLVPWALAQGGFSLVWEDQAMAIYRKQPVAKGQ